MATCAASSDTWQPRLPTSSCFRSSARTSDRSCAYLEAAYPFQVDCAEWTCSLALLSRLPFEGAGVGRIASDQPAFVWARLGGSLTIIGTHLYRPSRNPWLHERQVTALAQFIGRIDSSVILAGDLNTSPWSNAFRKLRPEPEFLPSPG